MKPLAQNASSCVRNKVELNHKLSALNHEVLECFVLRTCLFW